MHYYAFLPLWKGYDETQSAPLPGEGGRGGDQIAITLDKDEY